MNKAILFLSAAALSLGLVACGPSNSNLTTPDGSAIQGDKGISGAVTGSMVGPKTKIAVFGAFTNVSGNKIDTANKTIDADTTLATSPVTDGKYSFSLPKGPQKAQVAAFQIYAFNDSNDNNMYDDGEMKSKEATVRWSLAGGYTLATDADGNQVADLFGDFKNFDFKLGDDTTAASHESSESAATETAETGSNTDPAAAM